MIVQPQPMGSTHNKKAKFLVDESLSFQEFEQIWKKVNSISPSQEVFFLLKEFSSGFVEVLPHDTFLEMKESASFDQMVYLFYSFTPIPYETDEDTISDDINSNQMIFDNINSNQMIFDDINSNQMIADKPTFQNDKPNLKDYRSLIAVVLNAEPEKKNPFIHKYRHYFFVITI